VRGKAIGLILLVVFAAAATSFALGISSNRPAQQNIDFAKPNSIVPVDGNQTGIGTDGIPVDSPGMPH
jgi:hypothetical protein